MAVAELVVLLTAKDHATKVLQQAGGPQGLGGLSKTLATIGPMAAAAGAAAAAGLGLVAVSSIRAASDLNESLSKVGVVFGDAAGDIDAFAKTAANSLGLTRNEALAATGTLGNMFGAMGMASLESAGLSKQMVQMAADFASFNNIPVPEALEKIRAGLVGESEPLRSMGVLLTEASVAAKAVELGLAGSTKELTEANKVQARAALIMEQGAAAQGDFARTSTGLANSQRIITAAFGDLQAEIGQRLLPVIAPLVANFAKWLPQAIDRVLPVLDAFGRLIMDVAGFVNQHIRPAVEALFQGIGRLAAGWRESTEEVQGATAGLWAFLEPTFSAVGAELSRFVEVILPELQETWELVTGNIATAMANLFAILEPAIAAFSAFWDTHHETIKRVADVMWDAIATIVKTAWNLISGFLEVGLNVLQGDWRGAWQAMERMAERIWGDIRHSILGAADLLADALGALWRGIRDTAIDTWHTLWGQATAIWHGIRDTVADAISGLAGFLAGAWQGVRNTAADAWNGIARTITGAFEGIVGPIQGIINRVMGLLGPLQGALTAISNWRPPAIPAAPSVPAGSGAGLAQQVTPVNFGRTSSGAVITDPSAPGFDWGVFNAAKNLGQIPIKMALGGVLTEPVWGVGLNSGRPYQLAERGPERVLPMTGGGASMGSGGTAYAAADHTHAIVLDGRQLAYALRGYQDNVVQMRMR